MAVTVLFVAGAVLSLKPTPRQRQLARLRGCAMSAGLRVRVIPGEGEVDYALPWRLADLDRAAAPDFVASRDPAAGWTLALRSGPPEAVLLALLEPLPGSVSRVVAGADGIAARWDERGADTEVARIAKVLIAVRAECAARAGRNTA